MTYIKNSNKHDAPKTEYFAAMEDPKECVAVLARKADDWFDSITQNNYLTKIKRCWSYYHGSFFDDAYGGHEIQFGGEEGELTNIPVNHFRNIAQHMLNMVTSNRPAFQARATNKDHKSIIQTNLANGLLDYYMREKKLDRFLRDATEYAIVMGSGYIKMEWDSTSGEVLEFNEETNTASTEGDIRYKVLSPLDVVFDSTKENVEENEWVITRSWVNKYNLGKKYYEQEDKIVELKTKSDYQKFRLYDNHYDDTDDIAVYEFFHKPCESLPYGRFTIFLEGNIVLYDSLEAGSGMPYRELPVYRISPSNILGTPYGYSPMFDVLPIQDAVNSLYSTILTNQTAFGVQSILNPRGSDISVTQLTGSLNVIDYNPRVGVNGGGKPEPFNPTMTPPEIFNYLQKLEGVMETLTSINPVVRGNVEAIQKMGARSGNALALVQAQSLQFMSGLQNQYIHLIEDVGTGTINLLKDFAAVPRVAAIAGISNKTEMKEFTGDDLSTVNRVIVDVGNAMSQTLGGKIQLADNLLQQFGPEAFPIQSYINVLNTGRLDMMTDGLNKQGELVNDENERLVDGSQPVKAMLTDQHLFHIKSHRDVLADTELRHDEELAERVTKHLNEHIALLKGGDADLLVLLGETPLGQGQPQEAQGGATGGAPQGAPQGQPQGAPPAGADGLTYAEASPLDTADLMSSRTIRSNIPAPAEPSTSPDGMPVLASESGLGAQQ